MKLVNMSDMVEQNTIKILEDLGEIKGELKGINKRLDRVNGSLGKHEEKIAKNAIKLSGLTGRIIGMGAGAGAVLTVLLKGVEALTK